MPAQFGAFQVNRACRHAYGETIELELEPGRYEPKDAEDLTAMRHLATVPLPDSEGEFFAVQIEDPPAPVSAGERPEPDTTEPDLPEPPAAPEADAAEPEAAPAETIAEEA